MNLIERKMVDALNDLREHHGVIGVKAEFEAEGTRLEEALRLKDVVSRAGLGLTLKIGGCEALRDAYEARTIGVERIVAPMVESPFALKKFLGAMRLSFPEDERSDVALCVNIETITAVENFDAMLALPDIAELDGVVVGRVDLSGSLGLPRDDINDTRIWELTTEVAAKAKRGPRKLEVAVGGGVSAHSLPFFRRMPEGLLDRYETRKVIFGCPRALDADADAGILKAVGFELMWLKNKRDYYQLIASEDEARIRMLEARYGSSIEEARRRRG